MFCCLKLWICVPFSGTCWNACCWIQTDSLLSCLVLNSLITITVVLVRIVPKQDFLYLGVYSVKLWIVCFRDFLCALFTFRSTTCHSLVYVPLFVVRLFPQLIFGSLISVLLVLYSLGWLSYPFTICYSLVSVPLYMCHSEVS